MIKSVNVIGRGRVGSALAARLEERGVELREDAAELDPAVRSRHGHPGRGPGTVPGTGLGRHTSAERRRSRRSTRTSGASALHPLQTFTRARGPEQLDGAWAAVTAESDEARELGFELARGARPGAVRARRRRAGALPRGRRRSRRTTWSRCTTRPRALRGRGRRAAGGARAADAPDDRERLRADRARSPAATGRRSRRTARRSARARPDLEPLYDVLAEATAREDRAHDRGARELPAARADDRPRADDGRASTTGTSRSSARRATRTTSSSRASSSTRRSSARARTSSAIRATRSATRGVAEEAGVDVLFVPAADEIYPPGFETWVEVERLGSILEGEHRPGPLPRRRDGLPEALQHRPAATRLLRPEGRAAGGRRAADGARPRPRRSRSASSRPCATRTASPSPRATPTSPPRSASVALALPARAGHARSRAARRCSTASRSTTSRSPTSSPRVLAAAVRVGTHPPHRQRRPGRRLSLARPRKPAPARGPGQAPADRARRDEAARREDRDGHRLRLPERPPRRRGRRRRSSSSATRPR